MSNLTLEVPIPTADQINGGHTPCPTNLLTRKYGLPIGTLPKDCGKQPTSKFWAPRMVTESVGPFRATGHRLAVGLLRESLAAVKAERPDLYAALGNAGMLCVRHVRGHPGVPSNHCYGLAVDLTLEGKLDDYGDGMTQKGLLDLYGIFKYFGWFWGAEFGKEDSMHFEVSGEVVMDWIRMGIF